MKKFLPIILFLLGLIVVIVAFFVVRARRQGASVDEEETALIDVPLEERPVVSLTPTADGHYLNLKVEKIMVKGATSMDYELLYKVPGGPIQGVPGTVDLEGKDSFEAELLLGSESSGKFRYDEGVEEGTLTLRFRNDKGKLLVKFSTEFHLQDAMDGEFTTIDGNFTYRLIDKIGIEGYFVAMETFGFLGELPGDIVSGPYGLFGSDNVGSGGNVEMDGATKYFWNGDEWIKLDDEPSAGTGGVFIGTN